MRCFNSTSHVSSRSGLPKTSCKMMITLYAPEKTKYSTATKKMLYITSSSSTCTYKVWICTSYLLQTSLAHSLLRRMSSEQMTNHRSASRSFCCFITSLSFVIIVPTLCVTLILLCAWTRDRSNMTLPPEDTGDGNRTVRLLARSCTIMHRSSYSKIILHADLVSADILHSTMLVEWAGWDTCKVNCTEVNFFVNT